MAISPGATRHQILRGTRADLDTLTGAGELLEGEPYFITDESRIAYGTSPYGYETYAKLSEIPVVDPAVDALLAYARAQGWPIDPPYAYAEVAVAVQQTVEFAGSATSSPNAWEWDFGDGNYSSEQNPTHHYDAPGDYTVSLRAANAYAGWGMPYSFPLEVEEDGAPVASFTSVTNKNVVVFTNTSTEAGTFTYLWDFGDGKTSTEANPVHGYLATGDYDVTLITSNAGGASEPFEDAVEITEMPTTMKWRFTITASASGVGGYVALREIYLRAGGVVLNDPVLLLGTSDNGHYGSRTASKVFDGTVGPGDEDQFTSDAITWPPILEAEYDDFFVPDELYLYNAAIASVAAGQATVAMNWSYSVDGGTVWVPTGSFSDPSHDWFDGLPVSLTVTM